MGVLAGRIGRNDGLAPSLGQPLTQLLCIVGAICDQPVGDRHTAQQSCGAHQIMRLSGGEREGDRAAFMVGQGMNFGRPSAARSADGVGEVPPFAPAAERWALMWVESTAVVLMTPLDPVKA